MPPRDLFRAALPGRHPGLDELADLLAPAAGPGAASRAMTAAHAAHAAECARCRASLAFLRDLARSAAAPTPEPPAGLRERVLASRAAGVRALLPTADAAEPDARTGRGRRLGLAAAAAVVAAVGASLAAPRADVEAGTTGGVLTATPALARPGQLVAIRYRPAAALSGEPWLVLRARVRRPGDDSYNAGLPVAEVARLARQGDGTYAGAFALPDSAVFAALAVEDSAAATVDDAGGRAWEIMAAGEAADRPSFAALDQRAHDLMGRNAEEGFATARRMVAVYPDSLGGWSWLKSHQVWLGRAGDDSVRALHRAQVARFDARLSGAPRAALADVGLLAWYAQGVDSAAARRWRARLLREAPAEQYAVQWRLFDVLDALRASRDTAAAFARLDTLWVDAGPAKRREQVAGYAGQVAWASGDTAQVLRWADRRVAASRDPGAAAGVAAQLARRAGLRPEGLRRLRAELARLAAPRPAERALGETAAEQRARDDAARRRVLAAVGRALVADGRTRAALDTLALATAAGWDVPLLRSVRAARLAAGDTAGALWAGALVAADPRTPAAFADSLLPLGERVLGAVRWADERGAARRTFVDRMLAQSTRRALAGAVRLTDAGGRERDLRELAGGRVTVVAFTSPECAYAVDDLPRLTAAAARLERAGVRVVTLVEAPGPSPALAAFLAKGRYAGPVYFDARHEASRALNQWGTPYYYVLDVGGRVRFEPTSSADEVLARAEAVRAAEGG